MRVRERVVSYFFALVHHACAPHVAFSRTCAQEKNEALLFFPPSNLCSEFTIRNDSKIKLLKKNVV